jgi:ribulose 1,5-bisphosphate synthetase/thiazole synthase
MCSRSWGTEYTRAEKERCMPSPNSKSDIYDVIVVGASFAGLSFASVAAALGLCVLVVERDAEIGGIVRTTGVLFSDVLDIIDVPARYLMNSIRRIQLQPPDHPPVEVSSMLTASIWPLYQACFAGWQNREKNVG